MEFSDSLC
ncbi:unnamed protein product [Cyprideis torosa]|uniref:Uncharacterized protein n=1 Tax=Cyprideis torosa TaxID=163714 RepID=A0A7R8ZL78_9CRUS|nr:unnamed protein product [Cyprideis torosa]CAG0891204.1 unnamed protein product [Cyprideis torosa]